MCYGVFVGVVVPNPRLITHDDTLNFIASSSGLLTYFCAVTILGSNIVHDAGLPVPGGTYLYCDAALSLTGVSTQLVCSR
jgi:hypothetical protein